MAIADLDVTYGGPYSEEITALINELNDAKRDKREPDFENIAQDWTEISAGALSWIESKGWIPVHEDGPFVNNVIFKEDAEAENEGEYPEVPFTPATPVENEGETPEEPDTPDSWDGKPDEEKVELKAEPEIDLGDEPTFDELDS